MVLYLGSTVYTYVTHLVVFVRANFVISSNKKQRKCSTLIGLVMIV